MKKISHWAAALLLFSTLHSQLSTVFAQGTAFTYQGQLQDNGSPASGSYAMTFTLFNVNTGGVNIAEPVTNNAVSVSNGLFLVTIDFGAEAFTGATNWLEIGVATNGVSSFNTLSPRQPLTPTPYAIYSANAGGAVTAASAGSVAGSNIVGSIPVGQLSASVVTNGASGVNLTGTFIGTVAATSLQVAPFVLISSTNYTTNGTFTFTVPPSVTGMIVKLWGAGGGAGGDAGQIATAGGGGAFSQVTLTVTPGETFVVVVGQGGEAWSQGIGGGNGHNDASGGDGGLENGGGGGQGSSLFYHNGSTYVMKAVAGGGGGGGAYYSGGFLFLYSGQAGQASGSGSGYAAAATTTGVPQLSSLGGNGSPGESVEFTGGGGGGYGGGVDTEANGGGSFGDTNISGSTFNPGNEADPFYLTGSAIGADSVNNTNGADGLAVVLFTLGGVTGTGNVNVYGNLNSSGALTAGSVSGNGGGLTNLNAAQLSGSVPSAALTSVPAASLTGVIPLAQLPSTVVTNFETAVTLSGTFNGNGGGLTSLNASQLTGSIPSGVSVPSANLTGALPAISGASLTSLNAGNLTGALPALNGANLTSLSAWQLTSLVGGSSGNFFLGSAGNATTSGEYNTGSGLNALVSNTSGSDNTATGSGALHANTSGSDNTAIGINALHVNTTGFNNVAVGSGALSNNSSGSNNIAIGFNAGDAITTTSSNIDIGNIGVATDNNIIRIGTTQTATYLVGTVFANGVSISSDRNVKENFMALDAKTVLAKVTAMPVTEWNYKTDSQGVRHIGPMAQDFHAEFGLDGSDEKHISVVDESGVALAAIQGLNQKLEAENAELKRQNDSLAERLDKLEATMKQLAAQK